MYYGIAPAVLDEVGARLDIHQKVEKHADLELKATLLGIQLVDGLRLMPKASRFVRLVLAIVDLSHSRTWTPLDCKVLFGILQWHNLLCRPLFSTLSRTYAFGQKETNDCVEIWPSALDDLVLNVILCPAWVVELDRPL